MNIKDFLKKDSEQEKYASSFRRSTAAIIDIWIVLFLRVIIIQTLGTLWLNQEILNFMEKFHEKFGSETIKNTREHIDFIINNRIFFYALIFYAIVIFVGAIYHAFLNSSAWQATIGKRFMKIMIVREPDYKLTFGRAMWHYFLSVLPFAFIFYLMSYQLKNNLNFYQAITSSEINVFLGFAFLIWIQIHLFTKQKTTAYDLICNTLLINGKTAAKWPWNK